MRLATWNVNSLRSRIDRVEAFLTRHDVDVLALQETKAREDQLPLMGLQAEGYDVAVAVDGMDGWNALRAEHFDLLITDIDMPRMDGIELVSLIKKDARLRTTPVMIVSYKDREEDRRRGLDSGADFYLTKGGFHEEALLQAVVDLIGEASA